MPYGPQYQQKEGGFSAHKRLFRAAVLESMGLFGSLECYLEKERFFERYTGFYWLQRKSLNFSPQVVNIERSRWSVSMGV